MSLPGEAPSPAPPVGSAAPLWQRMLGGRPDDTVLRWIFRTLVAMTMLVLGWDLAERMSAPPPPPLVTPGAPGEDTRLEPYLPSVRPGVTAPSEARPGRTPEAKLREPMTIELLGGGRLEATGTITPGTAERFAAELDRRGDYVKTVVLSSPGGSVDDALAMGKLIRARKIDTRVEANGLCASSCPLAFAGGVNRMADKGASLGVHQVFAVGRVGSAPLPDAAEGMARAQRVSAECQRHLVAMGIDPRVWISAMETPPQEMFYFTPAELIELKLATPPPAPAR